jgi:hypothetical protein
LQAVKVAGQKRGSPRLDVKIATFLRAQPVVADNIKMKQTTSSARASFVFQERVN